ncbi:MAG: nitrogen fixation protein AnfA [uncultured bacterium]|nr:MAG: nitrogen fixation protein AnfA [uncultured bacterium]
MLSRYLELLSEVTKALTTTIDLEETLAKILVSFSHFLGMNRCTITLLDENTQVAKIKASVGLTKKEIDRGIYRLGEGITGYVLQSGEPIVIPLISKDFRFLNKTKSRKTTDELSFFCVPIKQKDKVIGALSSDRNYEQGHFLQNDLQVLEITTSIVSHILFMYDLRDLDRKRLIEENNSLRTELQHKFQFSEIIGHSDKMVAVFKLLTQVTKSNATVMIRGESGTGKELIANAIHYNSVRSDKPFIKVNCSAIPESLLESELFGYDKGAFTGANASKPGKFELAQGGTIFLDEIGDFAMPTQVKLLRVLQAREVGRLGAIEDIKLDVRVIVATNRNLEEDMKSGKFREDLYYRVNVFPVFLPPLRERKTDILLLAEHFLGKYSKENNKKITRITTPAINMLMSYHWPGNVRELENCIERAVLVCEDNALKGNDLPPSLQFNETKNVKKSGNMMQAIHNLEQEMIIESLKRNHGSQRKTSLELGITERILGYKIQKYNIVPKFYTDR